MTPTSLPRPAQGPSPSDDAREMWQATERWVRRVLHAIRPFIPKEPRANGTLTLLIRGGKLRADFTSQVKEDDWIDASQ